MALANLYVGFDVVSRGATTSFVGPWRIWQVFSLTSSFLSYFTFAFNVLTCVLFHSCRAGLFSILTMRYLGVLDLIRESVYESFLMA